jgi:phosphinothricin acetyltransferase
MTGRSRSGIPDPGEEVTIRPVSQADAAAITAIFNHYVRRSFAAFPDREVGRPFILQLLDQAKDSGGFVAETGGEVIGFGMVRPLYPFPNLMAAGEVAFFICPRFTGKGTGTRLLAGLEARARELGMTSLVARVSSRNRRSLRFHRKNGFSICGRIREIGIKFGKPFDVVILQRFL